jgi:protocatechuate 3,4-dioxygenase beta subunit
MKKALIFTVLVLFASINIFASNDKTDKKSENKLNNSTAAVTMLSGTIIDQITGEALAGVKVVIEQTNQVVYTDLDGNFVFPAVKPGQYNIDVNYISYETVSIKNVNVETPANSVKIGLKTVNK